MHHSTPERAKAPSAESLLFVSAFARLYSPTPDNEATARIVAHNLSHKTTAKC